MWRYLFPSLTTRLKNMSDATDKLTTAVATLKEEVAANAAADLAAIAVIQAQNTAIADALSKLAAASSTSDTAAVEAAIADITAANESIGTSTAQLSAAASPAPAV